MALPTSGSLSLSEIATEYSVAQANISLATMSTNISLTAPHAVSEFYGLSSGPAYTPLTYSVVEQGGTYTPFRVYYNNSRWFVTTSNDNQFDISDNNATSFSQGAVYLKKNAALAFNGNTVCSIDLSDNAGDFRISRSTNNGTSWSTIFTDVDGNFSSNLDNIHIFYQGSNRWVAFSDYTTYISTDNGASWSFSLGNPSVFGNGGGAQSGSRIIINDNANFYLSDNGFATKTVISLPFVNGSKYAPNNIATNGSGTWLAWKYIPLGRMLKSTNNGSTWSAITTDLPSYENGTTIKYNQGTYGDSKFFIAASTYAGNLIGGVYSSGNNGSNFNANPLVGSPTTNKGAIGVHHNGTDLVAAGQYDNYKIN